MGEKTLMQQENEKKQDSEEVDREGTYLNKEWWIEQAKKGKSVRQLAQEMDGVGESTLYRYHAKYDIQDIRDVYEETGQVPDKFYPDKTETEEDKSSEEDSKSDKENDKSTEENDKQDKENDKPSEKSQNENSGGSMMDMDSDIWKTLVPVGLTGVGLVIAAKYVKQTKTEAKEKEIEAQKYKKQAEEFRKEARAAHQELQQQEEQTETQTEEENNSGRKGTPVDKL